MKEEWLLEHEMEDLIAAHPDDFFPGKGFELRGRQQSFAGVGRFDLLFVDRFRTNVLMELKAVPAKYDVAEQLAKYKDELEARGEKHVLMWVVAPQIATSTRELLDRIGIEFTEIHFGEFRRVAHRYGITIQSESVQPQANPIKENPDVVTRSRSPSSPVVRSAQVETGPVVTQHSPFRWKAYGYDLALQNAELFDKEQFGSLVDAFEHAVPSKRNASLINELRSWAANPSFSRWHHRSCASLLRWVTTSSYRVAVPHAQAVWKYLFGEPVPTWYVWRQAKGYEFDEAAWRNWVQSLPS
jgi:endonuclease NucS-like protein